MHDMAIPPPLPDTDAHPRVRRGCDPSIRKGGTPAMGTAPLGSATPQSASPSTAADDDVEKVRAAHRRLESIIDGLVGGGVLLDRALLSELASFLEEEAWRALDAHERLLAREVEAEAALWEAAPDKSDVGVGAAAW